MKKNKINIILISVVISIWLLVGLKATGNLFSNEEVTDAEDEMVLSDTKSPQKLMNEKLLLNYRDPFLGLEYQVSTNNSNSQVSVNNSNVSRNNRNQRKEIPITKEIPPVKFFGLVRNTGTNKMVAIVSVNNQEKRMLTGETFNEIKLEKITKDSILVSWGKNKLYVKK